ncbi:MAG: TRAFs-binding domain-containing protein [Cyclobacteriaceae bacterium]
MEDQIIDIEQLIEQGRYLEARSLTQAAIEDNSSNIRLQQLHALALSKGGMPGQAKVFLEKVHKDNPEEAETAGILGGIYKTLFKQTEDSEYAIQSRDTYLKNFSITGNYYTGINAATMSAIAGQARKGREIAQEVINVIGEAQSFWEIATLGEAYLLSKDAKKSLEYYQKARQLTGTDWGKVSSVHNQLWLLSHYMNVPSDILKIFNPPAVAAFIGHMIDRQDRPYPRFPSSIEGDVKSAIKASIRSNKIAIGYCSLACGSDILFAEAMEEEGGEVNIYLPFNRKDFIRESVSFAGEKWVERFDTLMARHPAHFITQENYDNHSDLFSMQSKVVLGSTLLRRNMIHSDAFLLSVLSDIDFSRLEGGTRDNMSLWPFQDKIINISPNNYLGKTNGETIASSAKKIPSPSSVRPALYTLVIDSEKTEEWPNLVEILEGAFEAAVVPPLASTVRETQMIVGFSSLRPLWDFIQLLRKTKGINPSHLRLSINGGPILLDNFREKETVKYRVMNGSHVDHALNEHQFSLTGSCIAVSPIAYELPLYKVEIELLSRVHMQKGEVVEVFNVLG